MKKIIIIIFICFLFLGCIGGRRISSSSFYLRNISSLSINAKFYDNRNGKISQVSVNAGQTSLIEIVEGNDAWRSGINMGSDSITVVFSDGKKKTDVHCANEQLPSTARFQCLQDTISLYYWKRIDSKTGSTTYMIDNSDYLEAR